MFEIYDYSLGETPMIEAGYAHGFFTGMYNGFARYNAPANMITEANKLASTRMGEHNRGAFIYTETNPLPRYLRPQTLMRFKSA